MKKNAFITVGALGAAMALCPMASFGQDMPLKEGVYAADWNSLAQWECPEWFKDAKFGIWAHWGPQCEAEDGDWYARHMYYPGEGQYNWHLSHYGNPKEFGLKDLCNEWKAEKWNPKELVELYKSVGARYFMVLANHHDNMDLWDSPYQEWNSVRIGPKRDIVGEWADACKQFDLPLGVSVHASHAWTWLEGSQAFDGNLTKEDGYIPNADGSEKWWKGFDPQELYAQNHPHSTGWQNVGSIHSQWDWGNGASIPSDDYKRKMMNRTLQLVYDYSPDMIYFDDTVLPFYGCDEQWGPDFLSSYYNFSAEKNGGKANVVVTGKQLLPVHKEGMLWDVERGIPDRMQELYWQTCTCIGDWHYNRATYNNNSYKSGATVVRMLMDVISKNGNLLLNIPVKGDGTIDDKERKVLADIKEWMDINAEAVYGTRVWKTFGEGPLAESDNPMNAQGFNEGLNYTSSDIRFVTKDNKVYAAVMAWPGGGDYTIKSFSPISEFYSGNVTAVSLLGYGDLTFRHDNAGLTVTFPDTQLNSIAPVLAITTDGTALSMQQRLDALIESVEEFISVAQQRGSYYNTGMYDLAPLSSLVKVLEEVKTADNAEEAFGMLNAAYDAFTKTSVIKGANLSNLNDCLADITLETFKEDRNFARSDGGRTRFGKPINWIVENFKIPNGGDGTKEGIDSYSGNQALMLGIWNDRSRNQEGDLDNARIYQKVTLPQGLYFFGGAYNTTYNINPQAYMFVAESTLKTADIPSQALAYRKVADCSENINEYNGLYFYLPEEKEIVIGWQADLANGAETQEFRVEKVVLLKMKEADNESLSKLCTEVNDFLSVVKSNNRVNGNTGSFTEKSFNRISAALSEAQDAKDSQDAGNIFFPLKYEWDLFLKSQNILQAPSAYYQQDLTTEKFVESIDFTPFEATGTRFAAPLNWTVENFSIPNGSEGTKEGLDSYTNSYALMLGIWDDRDRNQKGSLDEARIYRKVYLDKGDYYFGARYNALYNLHEAYTFVMPELSATSDIPLKALSHDAVAHASLNNDFHGLCFTIENPGEYYIGWQADLLHGDSCQEFRAEEIKLLKGNDNSAVVMTEAEGLPEVTISGKTIYVSAPVNISVYTVSGVKVADTYADRLDCRSLSGMYIVKAGRRTLKAVF